MKKLLQMKIILLKSVLFISLIISLVGSVHHNYLISMSLLSIPLLMLMFSNNETTLKIAIPSMGMIVFLTNIYLSIQTNFMNYIFINTFTLVSYIGLAYYYKRMMWVIEDIENRKKNERVLSNSIYKIAEQINQQHSDNINSILKKLCHFSGFEQISIYHLIGHDSFHLTHHVTLLENSTEVVKKSLKIDDFNLIEYTKTFKDLFIYDEQGANQFSNYIRRTFNSTSFVFVPILSKNNHFAGFFLYETVVKEKRWDYEDFKILKVISNSYTAYLQRKENETTIEKSAKLSALGEISAGIAHEINNPLAIIHGQSSMMKMMIAQAIEKNQPLNLAVVQSVNDLLLETISRTDKIVNGLRYFVKNDENNPFVKTELENIFSSVQILSIDRCKKNGIHVDIDLSSIPDGFTLECKPIQLAQVFINLINNSYDAIKEINSNDKWIKIIARLDKAQDDIIFSVIDSGNGIPIEIGNKILEKFYTTKTHTKTSGSGIGLNIAKRIIELHHGEISIDNQCPNTKFDIKLPLVQPAQ